MAKTKSKKDAKRYHPLNVYPSTKKVIEKYSSENMDLPQTKCADILVRMGYQALKMGYVPTP